MQKNIPIYNSSRMTPTTYSIAPENHQHQQQILTSNACLAYFLYRTDIDDYKPRTLTQTLETVLSRTKSRGLKVRLSLQDEGLIIENLPDPNQSWLFKASELIEYWVDPYSNDVCIVITGNHSHHALMPYSASIFRLRGKDYIYFIQEARGYFGQLKIGRKTWKSSSMHSKNSSRNNDMIRFKYSPPETTTTMTQQNISVEKPSRVENWLNDKNHPSNRKAPRHASSSKRRNSNEKLKTTTKRSTLTIMSPSETSIGRTQVIKNHTHNALSTPKPNSIRLVTRSEFDTGAASPTTTTTPEQTRKTLYNFRTYSESAVSSNESQVTSKDTILTKTNITDNDNEDTFTTVSSTLPGIYVAELIKELKELRVEIAALKTESNLKSNNERDTSQIEMRSMSTSPLIHPTYHQDEFLPPSLDETTVVKRPFQISHISETKPSTTIAPQTNYPQPPPLPSPLPPPPPLLLKSVPTIVTSVRQRTHSNTNKKSSKEKHTKRNPSGSSTTSTTTVTVSDAEETLMERPPYTDNAPLSITYAFNSSSNHISQFNGTAITSSSIDDNPSPTLRGTREEELLAKVPFVIENEMIKLLQKNPNNNDTTTTSKSNPLRNKIRYDGENSEAMETTIAMEPIYENVPLKSETKEYVNMPISASTNDFPHGSYYYYTADSNTNNSAQTQEKPRRTRKSKNQQQQQVDVQRNGIDNALTFTQEQLQQYIAQQSPSSSDFDTQSQQYVTQLLQQNGYILQPMSSDVWTALFNQSNPTQQQQQNGDANNETGTSSVPTTISRARSNRNQPIYFANRLTNPVFSVDKELLTNTIANQFGYDIDSPQLQKLVQNQHLFAARRRTFANMVWQLTPDEEVALLSSSSTNHSPSNDLDTTTNETNNINSNQEHGLISNGKSILKKEVVKNKPLIISSTNTTAYNKRKNVSFTNATFYVS